jgi:hypothetical protein
LCGSTLEPTLPPTTFAPQPRDFSKGLNVALANPQFQRTIDSLVSLGRALAAERQYR